MFPDDTTLKRCTKCGELKPREAFSCDRAKSDGLNIYCRDCTSESARKYYIANRDRKHEYYAANAKRISEQKREHYAANVEREKERKREYYSANVKRIHEYRQTNAERIAERMSNYRKTPAGKASSAANHHHRRARKAGNGGAYTTAELADIRAAQTDKHGRLICWKCGKPIKDAPHLDHWTPLKHGGRNDAGNLHYMHKKCNLEKGAKMPTEIGRLL
jgi:hypothetical protein